jgi:transcription-repair coupling factor (superfamily II helicase)
MQPWLAEAARAWSSGTAWTDLPGDALAATLAGLSSGRRILVVVDEPDAAERLLRALRFFLPDAGAAQPFPADDVRPYDGFSPSWDLPALRTRAILRWSRGEDLVVVAPVRALLQRIPGAEERALAALELRPGDRVDRRALTDRLTEIGYLAGAVAEEPGHFAVRGDVVDVWVPGAKAPRRIDLFDDEVEQLRQIDPRNGRTLRRLQRVSVLPVREERLAPDTIDRLQTELARIVAATGRGATQRRRVVEDLRAGVRFSGVEDYLPALCATESALDAMAGGDVVVVHPGSVAASARAFVAAARRRWEDLDVDERPLVPPEERFVDPDALMTRLEAALAVQEVGGTARGLGFEPVEGLMVRGSDLAPVAAKLRKLADDGLAVGLVARDEKAAAMLEQLVEPHGLPLVGRASWLDMRPAEVSLLIGDLPRGFIGRKARLALVSSSALFGQRETEARRRAHALYEGSVTSLSHLKDGDAVVHRLHGVGRFRGLQRLELAGAAQDFVRVEYRGGDLLYLPATSVEELSRFSPAHADVEVKLDRLGGATWARRKAGVRDALLEKAQQLLMLQARRKLASRDPLPEPGPLYQAFVARFPYTETHDQARAIVDVHDDLSGDAPMDRLICGDVGFGKTEVAMRAAARVVEGGRQVAVMCPTTVLAFQHLLTFRERFEGLPVRVEMLSRFSSAAEARATLDGLASGAVDIVIGTHRLLGREVRPKALGLLVIDEEHRFGVSHKDKLRAMRADVDVLSMSATPIPRTLQVALSGARDMSIIASPPEDRLEVRTTVSRLSRTRVRDAILLELAREGQVYFVHNRVESIQQTADRIAEWVPEARCRVAHGQMTGEQLERILLDFMEHKFDVLVCTAIVESGVDLPNVNTMLIDRADQFGLAQLYQLRGRVGRSSTRGSCILLTPEELSRDARRRVQVLVEHTRLGSGFAVASADLELRGGGNLLGDAQSGHIDDVGFDTWVELLEEAVHAARGDVARAHLDPVIQVPVGAFIPETLVPDVGGRLGWYKRLSEAPTQRALDGAMAELESEVGELPLEVVNLAGLAELRRVCRDLGLQRVEWLKVRALVELHPASLVKEEHLRALAEEHPKRVEVKRDGIGPWTVSVRFTPKEGERPVRFLRWVLARLEDKVRAPAA